jgi:hypothetical protein
MKQTALNELIKIIKQKRNEREISNTLLRFVQIEAEKLLETEKQQIKDAFKDGQFDAIENEALGQTEKYFNETFKK